MSEKINITVGTAGHIDHGKTALVKLLTGCDTDTLKAEKERGMSIELGFAPCTVGGLGVGIVDVPGHEHFVKTMVAGASGMDAVILVVAADDGVMPQTREHLDILTLLGLTAGLTVITKIDVVDRDVVERRREELSEFLVGTFLENAPLVTLSSVTGEGFEGFYKALEETVRSVAPRSAGGVFRMPVERAFSPKGFGTVVTGIPVSGRAMVGDEVELLPEGTPGRINAIQVYGEDSQVALAGQCAALNVRRWDRHGISRGQTVAALGYFEPKRWFACTLRLLAGAAAIKNGGKVKFHTGTSVSGASVYLMEGDRATAGEELLVQFRADERLVAAAGERFIVRGLSPAATIGGGMIIEGLDRKLKRTVAGVNEDLAARALAVGDRESFALYCMKAAGAEGVKLDRVAHRIGARAQEAEELAARFVGDARAVRLSGGLYLSAEAAAHSQKRILEILTDHHRLAPESPGANLDGVRDAAGLTREVLTGLLALLEEAGKIARVRGLVALAGHRVMISEKDAELFEKVEAAFRDAPFAPPGVEEVIARTGFEAERVKKAVGSLLERGLLVRVAEGLFFHREAVEDAARHLVAHIESHGKLESVKFKYLLETTRKYAIPLLDYFDSVKVTVRIGNTRYLKGS